MFTEDCDLLIGSRGGKGGVKAATRRKSEPMSNVGSYLLFFFSQQGE
jgi:hypothetical protein